jgi:hypothetical protein
MGGIQADQSISFQAMRGKLQDFMKIIREDPAVDNVTGFTGGSRVNSGMMFITLKPRDQRNETAQQVIDRLRKSWPKSRGQPVSDGGAGYPRRRPGQRQLSVHPAVRRPAALREWEPKIRKALAALPELADVNSDQQDNGAEMDLTTIAKPCRAWDQRPGRQQPAEQRLRPAADLHHLPAAEPVQSGDGGRSDATPRTSAPWIRCLSSTAKASRSRSPISPNGSRPTRRCR